MSVSNRDTPNTQDINTCTVQPRSGNETQLVARRSTKTDIKTKAVTIAVHN